MDTSKSLNKFKLEKKRSINSDCDDARKSSDVECIQKSESSKLLSDFLKNCIEKIEKLNQKINLMQNIADEILNVLARLDKMSKLSLVSFFGAEMNSLNFDKKTGLGCKHDDSRFYFEDFYFGEKCDRYNKECVRVSFDRDFRVYSCSDCNKKIEIYKTNICDKVFCTQCNGYRYLKVF